MRLIFGSCKVGTLFPFHPFLSWISPLPVQCIELVTVLPDLLDHGPRAYFWGPSLLIQCSTCCHCYWCLEAQTCGIVTSFLIWVMYVRIPNICLLKTHIWCHWFLNCDQRSWWIGYCYLQQVETSFTIFKITNCCKTFTFAWKLCVSCNCWIWGSTFISSNLQTVLYFSLFFSIFIFACLSIIEKPGLKFSIILMQFLYSFIKFSFIHFEAIVIFIHFHWNYYHYFMICVLLIFFL